MNREKKTTTRGPVETEGLSQGLAEQAYVQAQSMNEDLREVGTAYSHLKTGACASTPGLCAEHSEVSPAERHRTTGTLQEKAKKTADTYADTMRRWSAAFRNYSVDDLSHQVQDFARRHPALLIGGAVIAGFALTRAIKAAGDSAQHTEPEYRQFAQAGRDFLPAEEEVFHS